MVVFTCNHCGDSLQKPKVEKHYAFVCRTVKSLTCVDCFKDFRAEEYVSHTKCVTEDERYAAKGTYVNGIIKKGEVKQESWVEMIKSILEEPDIHPSCRNLLNAISSYNNIPRKKPKFVNFIKSSFGGRLKLAYIEEVWDIIEKYKNNKSKNNERTKPNTISDKSQESSNDNISSAEKDLKNKENKMKKRKLSDETIGEDVLKKKKHKNVEIDELIENTEDFGVNKTFRFQDKILEILSNKGSTSLKKLQKKVLNAYLKEMGETEVTPKIVKKFNKKLKKISNLEIIDDRVTLLKVSN